MGMQQGKQTSLQPFGMMPGSMRAVTSSNPTQTTSMRRLSRTTMVLRKRRFAQTAHIAAPVSSDP